MPQDGVFLFLFFCNCSAYGFCGAKSRHIYQIELESMVRLGFIFNVDISIFTHKTVSYILNIFILSIYWNWMHSFHVHCTRQHNAMPCMHRMICAVYVVCVCQISLLDVMWWAFYMRVQKKTIVNCEINLPTQCFSNSSHLDADIAKYERTILGLILWMHYTNDLNKSYKWV